MANVQIKTEIEPIDGTPIKRMFLSIISDYDLQTGLCELVDNALDLWMSKGRRTALAIRIDLDAERQLICVRDNAGGVPREDLNLLIQPGGSGHDRDSEVIGTFGVGSKRAGIALGEQVDIRTRHGRAQSFELNITQQWLEVEGWALPAYAIPDIEAGTTEVHISRLRKHFSEQDIKRLRLHLGATYAWFIEQGCEITLNTAAVLAQHYEAWAYPPDHPPLEANFSIDLGPGGMIRASITAGLVTDRNPELENYGVYFYCNRRLIVKDLKSREVGYYVGSEAGVPHPDASLSRVVVKLVGPAEIMPWNSSKSGINYGHPAFLYILPTLIQLASHYSSLSRRLKDDWEGKVFKFSEGSVERIDPIEPESRRRLLLPSLPQARKKQVDQLKSRNKKTLAELPWTLGLLEALGAVEMISRQRLETKNRIALILLDSNFEIALKEFIVHREDLFPMSQFHPAALKQLFGERSRVIAAVTAKVAIPQKHLDIVNHYYATRNKLVHERATVDVTDSDIKVYEGTVQEVLRILFGLKFPK